ncbi:hypothetical protein IV38_GL000664 [Lactobacillus selangorensis]|uniref:Phosphatidic acid phosphatase type 2/haloperoxidase domain-containing protein n=1 Tax=Lactobacillus selangorensis TaxID=81857 RepID=A0A0R2FYY9_9LACO|nr:phosphatase PAP2 family protein [Lactobacillus selangorensis]KRN29774.1 hypothetical protein IV38_GL000664 [Lactobacillus selangorensis]KRN33697.1 hypothetical protein IV40_GL000004 [Lactobacillus selangorensis]
MMAQQQRRWSLLAICYFLFGCLWWGIVHHTGWIHALDRFGIAVIAGHPNPALTKFMVFITSCGNTITVVALTTIATLFLLYMHQTTWASFLLLNVGVFSYLGTVIKKIVQRPRPSVHHLVYAGGFSFPSGHSTGAILFYGALIIIILHSVQNKHWRRGLITLACFMIFLIDISRVYVHVHYPSDVLGGFFYGLGSLMLSEIIYQNLHLLNPFTPSKNA